MLDNIIDRKRGREMKQYDISAWIDRVQTNLDIQVAFQTEDIKMTFTRRELIELRLMFNDLRDMHEADRPHLCEDVPVQCINGSCPMALSAEYEERGMDVVHNCNECPYCVDKEQQILIQDSPKLAQELVQELVQETEKGMRGRRMTEQEAITVLNCIETHGSLPRKAKAKAIEALEKQMNNEQQTGLSAVENDGQLNI